MSWQRYVDEHFMCEIDHNQLSSAAILGLGGSVWAQSSSFPQDFMDFPCERAFTSMKTIKRGPGEYSLLNDAVNVGDGVGFTPNIQVGIGVGVAASKFYKPDKTYGPFVIAAAAGYTGKVGIGMGIAASKFYKPDKTYSPFVVAAAAGYTGKDCLYNYQTPMLGRPLKKPVLNLTDIMMNTSRDGNDPIQMHENFGTHDGQIQEGEGWPEDNGFAHDMSLDGVAEDPMQIDAVEGHPNFRSENVEVWFNRILMGLIDTTGIDSPDQLKGAAILIANLPTGQYIFKYVRYGQEIRMDNDDFHHFLDDLTDIHIWDGELVTVS